MYGRLFRQAIEEGNTRLVEILLEEEHLSVNYGGANGCTPLMRAVERGNTGLVRLLLDHKDINVNSQDYRGYSALSYGVEYGRWDCVKLMLETEGINVNHEDMSYCTPLLWASWLGKTGIAELLVKHFDINMNHRHFHGCTALMMCAQSAQEDCVKLLLKSGASITARNVKGENALMHIQNCPDSSNIPDEIFQLLYAAGAVPARPDPRCLGGFAEDGAVPSFKVLCLNKFRESLLACQPETNLFCIVPYLQLPRLIRSYLMYGQI